MENKTQFNVNPELKKLGELIKDIRVAMLTTNSLEGQLHSCPLMTQEVDFDGDLWFIISKNSQKVLDIQRDDRVNISYSAPHGKFISVSGVAELVQDTGKVKELWSKAFQAYFPQGPEDEHVQLLKVNVERAEYWESHMTPISRILLFANLSHKRPDQLGTHGTIDLNH